MEELRMRFEINLLQDGSAVTKEGEYIGTWDTDETGALYGFTPDGATEPLLRDVFMGFFSKAIANWHAHSTGEPEGKA